MSTSEQDFSVLLRKGVAKAQAKAPLAAADLRRCASRASVAVAKVTEDAASLELLPISKGKRIFSAYQLQLRKNGSDAPASDLGIYLVTEAGYPIKRWYSRRGWEAHPKKADRTFNSVKELNAHFKWLVSNPDSRLVMFVIFFQKQSQATAPKTHQTKKGTGLVAKKIKKP
jgi:hypothetical protein